MLLITVKPFLFDTRIMNRSKKIVRGIKTEKLEDLIVYAYYNPVKQKLNEVMNILRDFAINLVIRNAKLEKGDDILRGA